jgi:hypothetical protein
VAVVEAVLAHPLLLTTSAEAVEVAVLVTPSFPFQDRHPLLLVLEVLAVLTPDQTQVPAATTTHFSPDRLAAHQVSAPQQVPCSSRLKAAVLAWAADWTRQATGLTDQSTLAGHLPKAEVLAAVATPVKALLPVHQTTPTGRSSEPVEGSATQALVVATGNRVAAVLVIQNIVAAPMAFTSTRWTAALAG